MIVQIKIEVTDNERGKFKRWLDGKISKKLASRKEIKEHIITEFFGFLDGLESTEYSKNYTLYGDADGAKCPHCGTVNYFQAEGAYQVNLTCCGCGKNFSAQKRGDK